MSSLELENYLNVLSRLLKPIKFGKKEVQLTWDEITTPWYVTDDVGGEICSHLRHTVGNCECVLRDLKSIVNCSPDKDELDRLLRRISPFEGGSLCEIKFMYYQFGPLYYNLMDSLLHYISPETHRDLIESELLRQDSLELATSELPSPQQLGEALGKFGNLKSEPLAIFSQRLLEVGRATDYYLQTVAWYSVHAANNREVWAGLIQIQAAHAKLVVSISLMEPSWAVYFASEYNN
jgi:hypothetical protein